MTVGVFEASSVEDMRELELVLRLKASGLVCRKVESGQHLVADCTSYEVKPVEDGYLHCIGNSSHFELDSGAETAALDILHL